MNHCLRLSALTIFLTFAALTLPTDSSASVTVPDPSFGESGIVFRDEVPGREEYSNSAAEQPDGKFLLAGCLNDSFAVWRFNSDGTLDPSFAADGYYINNLGGDGYRSDAVSVTLQPDGKIIAAGMKRNLTTDEMTWAIVRLNANGTNDTSFANDGYSELANNGSAFTVTTQADGTIILSGYGHIGEDETSENMVVCRLRADGTPDDTFGVDGCTQDDGTAGTPGKTERAQDHLVLEDGSVIVMGYSTDAINSILLVIWKYTAAGILDTSFNGSGYKVYDSMVIDEFEGSSLWDSGSSIVVQPDGKYIIAGHTSSPVSKFEWIPAIWRMNPDGSLDTTFNGSGYVTDFGTGSPSSIEGAMYGIDIDANGKIVSAGYSMNDGGVYQAVIWRYLPDGSLDTELSETGYLAIENTGDGADYNTAEGLLLTSDGGYLVIGAESNDSLLVLWKYNELFQISSLPELLDASVTDENIEDDTENGTTGIHEVMITLSGSGLPVASVNTTFDSDLDWSGVLGLTNLDTFTSFVSGLATAPSAAQTYSLYIPYRAGDNGVGLCPSIEDLDEVGDICDNIFYIPESDDQVSLMTFGENEYWVVTGIANSSVGGFSATIQQVLPEEEPEESDEEETDANQISQEENALADTGASLITPVSLGFITISLFSSINTRKKEV